MDIDRQRIAAVRALEAWEADAMHGALMRHADAFAGCQEGSGEETELKAIVDLIEAYEAKRSDGKEPGGKG